MELGGQQKGQDMRHILSFPIVCLSLGLASARKSPNRLACG